MLVLSGCVRLRQPLSRCARGNYPAPPCPVYGTPASPQRGLHACSGLSQPWLALPPAPCLHLQVRHHGGPALPQPLRPRVAGEAGPQGTPGPLAAGPMPCTLPTPCHRRERACALSSSFSILPLLAWRKAFPAVSCYLQERMRFMDRAAAAAAAAPAAAPAAAAGLLCTDGAQPGTVGTFAHSTAASKPASTSRSGAPVRSQLAAAGCQLARQSVVQQAQQQQQHRQPLLPLAAETGREYYSNLCMKAVNQCVGRVIRHRGDWAAVLLVDARQGGAGRGGGVRSKGWVG